jgi:hypothetical protein
LKRVFAVGSKLTPISTPFEIITNVDAYTPLQLKQMGFDISTSFVLGHSTLLLKAIYEGDIVRVKQLIEAGANVNFGVWDNQPLAAAVCYVISK